MSTKTLALAASAFGLAVTLSAALARPAAADGMVSPEPQAAEEAGGGAPAAPGEQAPRLSAKLLDQGAAKDSAKVQVKVTGVESPKLQYKVDDGAAIETEETTVRFRGLKPGQHKISILLEGKDGAPLGPSETLDVTVP